MARVYPLFSSSKGNSTFIGSEKGGILIDAGVTCKRLMNALALNNIPPEAVKGIFVTHEHSDHIKGIKVFGGKTGCTIYGQRYTLQNMIDKSMISEKSAIVEVKKSICVSDHEIELFNTPHDTIQSCGYKIRTPDGKTCAICTDLGYVTPEVDKALSDCKLVLLESNYDENMLRTGIYPFHLKERILSKNGHLSNDDCTNQIRKMIKRGTTHFILGHLSEENNLPRIADETAVKGLFEFKRDVDYLLGVAPVETSGGAVIF